jgi:acyl-CoA reductase-like NAD-dependent aldehyde dehydrogenase
VSVPNGHASGAAAPGEDPLASLMETGLFYAPTVLADVTHDMAIANEEVFGPICTVLKVKGDSDELAVSMANSTAYGLGATVFSGSPARANAIAKNLRCGMVSLSGLPFSADAHVVWCMCVLQVGVNGYGLNYLVQSLPFGGVGESGFGRFSGPEGLRACCLAKSVTTDLVPGLALPTGVPPALQYPISKQGPAFVTGLIDVQFQPSLAGRAMGLLRMALPGVFGLPKNA